jgi:hypothetical protein
MFKWCLRIIRRFMPTEDNERINYWSGYWGGDTGITVGLTAIAQPQEEGVRLRRETTQPITARVEPFYTRQIVIDEAPTLTQEMINEAAANMITRGYAYFPILPTSPKVKKIKRNLPDWF